ncbi:MAG: hypothetical protein ACRELE_02085, partial [Gemmatimonadales bacterium]
MQGAPDAVDIAEASQGSGARGVRVQPGSDTFGDRGFDMELQFVTHFDVAVAAPEAEEPPPGRIGPEVAAHGAE